MKQHGNRGFTLVEVLVALFVMALMAAMAWRGVDGITRARTQGQQRMEQTLRLDTVITQWEQDLAAMQGTGVVIDPFTFDGATVRLTRRTEGGMQLVAWSLRQGEWLRWAGPAVTRSAELQDQWMRSQQLLGTEPQQLHALKGLVSWQLHCFREGDNGWSNCQSSGDVADTPKPKPKTAQDNQSNSPPSGQPQTGQQGGQQPGGQPPPSEASKVPKGVRLILNFGGDGPLQGTLTRDVMLAQ